MALTDALGNLVRFELLPGNRYDTIGVAPLIDGIDFGGLLADKAFDANWIIDELKEFKRIAMRSDKTDQSFSAMIYVASAIINAR
jgi:transposase